MTVLLSDLRPAGGAPPGPPVAHPIATSLRAVAAALDGAADARCWSLSDAELAWLVTMGHQVSARVDELVMRLVADASGRDLGAGSMATGTAAWLAAGQRRDRHGAARQVRLADDLGHNYKQSRAALAAGAVNTEQVRVIVAALRRLPAKTTVEQRRAVEAWLLEQAATFGPDDLRILGRRAFAVIDREAADAVEGQLLEAEEARARATARMWMRPVGDGSTRAGFRIPDAQADMLQAALDALVSPRRPRSDIEQPAQPEDPVDPDLDAERLPYDQRLGQAFCELIEHLPVDDLPQSGRSTPTVTINIDYDALVSGLGAATVSTRTKISAAQARRLACNASQRPLVLSGDSVVLDLGRARRFFTHHQRIAMATVQGGCIADGCERPPSWCEVHHSLGWDDDGRTDIHREHGGVLLCGRHHHLVHANGWKARIAPEGIPELVPPACVDPDRRPIRHRRFRRRGPF